MKHFIISIIIAGLAGAGGIWAADEAKGKEKAPAKSEKAEKGKAAAKGELGKPVPLQGTVVAITSRTLTLKGGEGKEDRKFAINKGTTIMNGEKASSTEEVKVGQLVTGSFAENPEGGHVLVSLQVKPKTPAAGETSGKK